jgi:hypothetical protein
MSVCSWRGRPRLGVDQGISMERFLAEQGVFPAQLTTFLSDGGQTVRQAQGEFRQFGEPILDWFHLAMRMTQLSQAIKGLPANPSDEQDPAKHVENVSGPCAARKPISGTAAHIGHCRHLRIPRGTSAPNQSTPRLLGGLIRTAQSAPA